MALTDFSVSLNGTVLGDSTQVLIHGIDGLGLDMKTSDVVRDGGPGEWQGVDEVAPRDLVVRATVISGALTPRARLRQVQALWQSVRRSTDQVLAFKLPDYPELIVFGRARGTTPDPDYLHRSAIKLSLRFRDRIGCSFNKIPKTFTGDLASSGTGASFPWTFPLSFGVGSTRVLRPWSGGDFDAPGIVRFTGGCTNPRLVNAATGSFVGYRGTLAPGEWVEFSTDLSTATKSDGSSVLDRIAPGSSWPWVPPGSSVWNYSATGDVSSTVSLKWYDPYAL
jgi:hypothetical protein